jgi:CheY-like chemotaxis protein
VLLVEDEAIVRDFACEALTDLGYEVVATADATEAIPHIEGSVRFDLVVTDLGLPGLDGHAVAKLARQRWPGIKILYVSGYGRNAMIDGGALDHGADLLSKPFDSRTLALKVRDVLERQASRPS